MNADKEGFKILTGIDTVSIVGINDEDQTLGVLVVVSPQGSDLVLSSDIPHCEADVLILDSLDVETYFQMRISFSCVGFIGKKKNSYQW